jgi:predicted nucleotidyltransferase
MEVGEYLNQRRESAARRLQTLKEQLGEQPDALGVACVYVTGSFGRGEAGTHSDIDLFIAGAADDDGDRRFSALNETCLKADLIRTTRRQGFADFSGDGEYLQHYTIKDLVGSLGKSEDDAKNTFTARLLLLLESLPLIGEDVHKQAIEATIEAYWRDYADHQAEFTPAFLVNDILRLWRTFCVNYEARTRSDPPEKKAKRKLKNYKLKHSRLLTCYSALAHLLAVHRDKRTVSPEDALAMTLLTPTERLERLSRDFGVDSALVGDVLDRYEAFLEATDKPEGELVKAFQTDPEFSRKHLEQAGEFGDGVASLLQSLGAHPRFFRLLTV